MMMHYRPSRPPPLQWARVGRGLLATTAQGGAVVGYCEPLPGGTWLPYLFVDGHAVGVTDLPCGLDHACAVVEAAVRSEEHDDDLRMAHDQGLSPLSGTLIRW